MCISTQESHNMESYYERNLVINNRGLVYKGIFRVDELFQEINRTLEERGYTLREKKSEELVTETGRKTFVELRPFKVKTSYITLLIAIRITLDNVTETKELVAGERQKFQNGDVTITFDAWLMTDYQRRWGMKPFVYFMKGIINKYLYKFPLEASAPGELSEDTAIVYGRIKKLLNSYTPKEGRRVISEKDVMREMEEEMKKGE